MGHWYEVFALHRVRILIPGCYGLARTVQFLAVALDASHGLLGPVDITRYSLVLPKVLIADAGTMAGNAIIFHRGSLTKLMPGDKTAAHLIRAADMALPAGRVTLLTMIFKGRSQRGTF